MQEYAILIPIVALLMVGSLIALGSGSGSAVSSGLTGQPGLRLVAGNFSAMLLRVVAYLGVIIAVQMLIGIPRLFLW